VINAVWTARPVVLTVVLMAPIFAGVNAQAAPLRFVDEAAQRGVADSAVNSTGPTFGDYDNDGDLDVFVPVEDLASACTIVCSRMTARDDFGTLQPSAACAIRAV